MDIIQGNFIPLLGNYTVIIHTLHTDMTSSCHIMLKGLFTEYDTWLVSSYIDRILTGATCDAGNGAHSFRNTWFHSLWGVFFRDLSHSLYIHYRFCQYEDYVYGLITLVCLPGLVWLLYLGLIWLIWCVPTVNTEYYYYTCTVFLRINSRAFICLNCKLAQAFIQSRRLFEAGVYLFYLGKLSSDSLLVISSCPYTLFSQHLYLSESLEKYLVTLGKANLSI